MNEQLQVLQALYDTLRAGQDAALVTVVRSRGSAPRGPGAKMLLSAAGLPTGTTGGGSAEHAAQQAAMRALRERHSGFHEFVLHNSEAADLGMICGGEITVYIQYIAAAQVDIAAALLAALQAPEDSWLVTRMREDTPWQCAIYTAGGGLTGALALDAAAITPHCGGQPVWLAEQSCFIEPLSQSGRACVFGGGHVARALVPVLVGIGFRALVFEDREAFAKRALFPDADAIYLCDFKDFSPQRRLLPADDILIMTRGHQSDFEVLLQALASPAAYIGMMGSRHKIAATKTRVLEAGFSEADFARVHTPIGLSIGAQTPAEIAISIAAELIAHRAGYVNL